jgi:hypothetical protein
MSSAADRERLDKLTRLARRPGTAGEGAAARAALQRLFERNPRLRADALTGLRIKLDRQCDHERPCCECRGEIAPGKGPHRHARSSAPDAARIAAGSPAAPPIFCSISTSLAGSPTSQAFATGASSHGREHQAMNVNRALALAAIHAAANAEAA